uniref:Uncharacterized protein n=1 Tax=Arundo donax TaxID=35708 RepID=A0A0A9F5M2_ARUDO
MRSAMANQSRGARRRFFLPLSVISPVADLSEPTHITRSFLDQAYNPKPTYRSAPHNCHPRGSRRLEMRRLEDKVEG